MITLVQWKSLMQSCHWKLACKKRWGKLFLNISFRCEEQNSDKQQENRTWRLEYWAGTIINTNFLGLNIDKLIYQIGKGSNCDISKDTALVYSSCAHAEPPPPLARSSTGAEERVTNPKNVCVRGYTSVRLDPPTAGFPREFTIAQRLVCYTAVFSVVTQRSSPLNTHRILRLRRDQPNKWLRSKVYNHTKEIMATMPFRIPQSSCFCGTSNFLPRWSRTWGFYQPTGRRIWHSG